jgi:CelD/BcsL family acetyltransferase involved in cellulose biosynthesis
MKVTVLPIGELGPSLLARWAEIQGAAPFLDSPYFAPGYARCAADSHDAVEVAILEDGARIIGFFPFERDGGNVGYPVGRSFSDFHGVIAGAATRLDARALLRGCGLSGWRFDHLLAGQEPFRAFHWSEAPSPYVDLSNGFEGYRAERKRAGSREIEKILYEARKAERREGKIRFEFHTEDDAAYAMLMRWKSAQLKASGQPNLLALPRVQRFLDRVRRTKDDGFTGVLSALYVGDTLAAVHLGMQTRTVMHYWLPAYNADLAAVSPGHLCFIEVAKAAAAMGVRRIDLGKGPEAYKQRLMSGSIPVAEGAIELRAHVAAFWHTRYKAKNWLRRSPLGDVLRRPARWLRRVALSRSG